MRADSAAHPDLLLCVVSSRRGVCGAGLALCMYIQLKFLNNGMRHFDVLFVLPIYQAFCRGPGGGAALRDAGSSAARRGQAERRLGVG